MYENFNFANVLVLQYKEQSSFNSFFNFHGLKDF